MAFPAYTPTPTRLVTRSRADGSEKLRASTTNVSLEQLADGIQWLDENRLSTTGGTISGSLEVTGDLDVVDNLDVSGDVSATNVDASGNVVAGGGITATAGDISAGAGIHFTGTQPTPTADPGQNYAHATNQVKVWAVISVTGGAATLVDGYNVSSVSVSGAGVRIFFNRDFATAEYAVCVSQADMTIVDPPLVYGSDRSLNVAGDCRVFAYDTAGVLKSASSDDLRFAVQIMGRQ
jgi:hypothetical protein